MSVVESFLLVLQIFKGFHQKAGRADRAVIDRVADLGSNHFDDGLISGRGV